MSMRYFLLLVALGSLLAGCGRNMYDQKGRYQVYDQSDLFADGTSSRPLIEGTVTRERGDLPPAFYTGQTAGGGFISESPIPVSLKRRWHAVRSAITSTARPVTTSMVTVRGMIVQKGFL